jgi:hypothetical protein
MAAFVLQIHSYFSHFEFMSGENLSEALGFAKTEDVAMTGGPQAPMILYRPRPRRSRSSSRYSSVPFLAAVALEVLVSISCSSPKPQDSEETAVKCVEPENPYTDGTGHYAGYEWAEQHAGATCNGPSSSFNEGCEEYELGEAEYEECEARKKAR